VSGKCTNHWSTVSDVYLWGLLPLSIDNTSGEW
jgi:hypothetical protein